MSWPRSSSVCSGKRYNLFLELVYFHELVLKAQLPSLLSGS